MLIYYLYYIIGDDLCVEERLVLAVLVMRLRFPLLLALLSHRAVYAARHSFDTHDYYVLEHDPRVGPPLSQVATRLGVQVVERAGELDNFWVVRAPKQQSSSHQSRDSEGDRVFARLAALRSTHHARDTDFHTSRSIAGSVTHLSRQELRQRTKRAPPPVRPGDDDDKSKHPLAQAVIEKLGIQDPRFPEQWHLINEEFPEHMMNVTALWDMGITGHGVVTAFVDDGLDYESEDLAENFVSVLPSRRTATCLRHVVPVFRSGKPARMISTTTSPSLTPNCPMTTTARAVLAKLAPSKITYVVSASHTTPRSPASVSSLAPSRTSMRPPRSITTT
jgi:hypothetical protein